MQIKQIHLKNCKKCGNIVYTRSRSPTMCKQCSKTNGKNTGLLTEKEIKRYKAYKKKRIRRRLK